MQGNHLTADPLPQAAQHAPARAHFYFDLSAWLQAVGTRSNHHARRIQVFVIESNRALKLGRFHPRFYLSRRRAKAGCVGSEVKRESLSAVSN